MHVGGGALGTSVYSYQKDSPFIYATIERGCSEFGRMYNLPFSPFDVVEIRERPGLGVLL